MRIPQRIAVLGSTGSIGRSTLDVVARNPDRFVVHALAARRDVDGLLQQIERFRPAVAVVVEPTAASAVAAAVRAAGWPTRVECGADGLVAIAVDTDVDTVVAGVVGAAGLPSSLAAARAGKRILLANKEALVMAGALFMQEVQRHGATLLPIDSEHNAIFQCWPSSGGHGGVRRILLTASGGPFRTLPDAALREVTIAQACAHPNWSMGPKISVDSATMMNKGLELIEACWLFDVPPARVDILIHPESVVHSLVEYVDGSVLAQLGQPDMRTPIAHALAWPERVESGVGSLDLIARGRLNFEAPDPKRFPCLRLAREAAEAGGTQPAILNAANEEAVAAFLGGRVGFMTISDIITGVLAATPPGPAASLEAVYEADRAARAAAQKLIHRFAV